MSGCESVIEFERSDMVDLTSSSCSEIEFAIDVRSFTLPVIEPCCVSTPRRCSLT